MKITKEHIFPTVVYNADNCLEEEHIESMKKHIMSSYNTNPITGWQSSPNLTEHKEYKSLVVIIHANIKNVFTDLKYEYDDYVITDMWSNVSKKGEVPVSGMVLPVHSAIMARAGILDVFP